MDPSEAVGELLSFLTGAPLAAIQSLPLVFMYLLIGYMTLAFIFSKRVVMMTWSLVIPAPIFVLAWLLGLLAAIPGVWFGEWVAGAYVIIMLIAVVWALANVIRIAIKR